MSREVASAHPGANNGKTELLVSGMTCNNCARHVTDALKSVEGVRSAITNLEGGAATVRWDPGATADAAKLLTALDEAGYSGKIKELGSEPKPRNKWSPLAGWHFNVAFGTAVTIPLMILEWL